MAPRRPHHATEGIASDLTAVARRLRLSLAMQREGTELMRENLRRRYPRSTAGELDALLERWLSARGPDAPGTPVPWQERRERTER